MKRKRLDGPKLKVLKRDHSSAKTLKENEHSIQHYCVGNNMEYADFEPIMNPTHAHHDSSRQYEQFSTLMNRVNTWLASNTHLRLISIESVDRRHDIWSGIVSDVGQDSDPRTEIIVLRSVRLWLRRKKCNEIEQSIGYCDFVSPCQRGTYLVDPLAIETNVDPQETIEHIFDMINNSIIDQKIAGQIISMETIPVWIRKATSTVDTKFTAWKLNVSVYESLFVYIVRVYYVMQLRNIMPLQTRRYGYKDFVPKCLRPTCYGVVGQYAPYDDLVKQFNVWLEKSRSGVEVISMQSMEYPMIFGKGVISHRTPFFNITSLNGNNYTVRILRVYFSEYDSLNRSFSVTSQPSAIESYVFTPTFERKTKWLRKKIYSKLSATCKVMANHIAENRDDEIINIQTYKIHHEGKGVYSGDSTYYEQYRNPHHFLIGIRIYTKKKIDNKDTYDMSIESDTFTPYDIKNDQKADKKSDSDIYEKYSVP